MERCLRVAGETSSDRDQPAEEAQSEGFIPKTVTEAEENLMNQYPTTNIQKVNSLCDMTRINFEMNYET